MTDLKFVIENELKKIQKKHPEITTELVLAIIEAESSGNPRAMRYEEMYIYINLRAPRPDNCTALTEKILQKTSFGLMQIMGGTARHLGFKGWLGELLEPETNIRYGVLWLSHLYDEYHKSHGIEGVIAAYNSGSPRKNSSGEFANQGYVQKIMKILNPGNDENSSEPNKNKDLGGNEPTDGNTASGSENENAQKTHLQSQEGGGGPKPPVPPETELNAK